MSVATMNICMTIFKCICILWWAKRKTKCRYDFGLQKFHDKNLNVFFQISKFGVSVSKWHSKLIESVKETVQYRQRKSTQLRHFWWCNIHKQSIVSLLSLCRIGFSWLFFFISSSSFLWSERPVRSSI